MIDSIVITWPTGHIDRLIDVNSDQLIVILEGSTTQGVIDIDEDIRIVERNITTATIDALPPESIQLFPNPGISQLHIQSSTKLQRIEILDAHGVSMNINIISDTSFEHDASLLPDGVYFIRVTSEDHKSGTFKWVKI